MKKLIPILAIFIFVTACDSPRSQRSILSSNRQGNGLSTGNGSGVTDPSGDNNSDDTDTETVTTPTEPKIPEDAKHCKFSKDGINDFESTSSHLGSYNLCQSSTDKNSYYAQFKTPPIASNGEVNICFIPHTTTGTNSIYVGNPMCGSFPDPKSVKKVTFVKYSQYSNATINSVMFFKDTSYYYPVYNRNMMTLEAYKICMNMLSYGQTAYCQAFKSVNQYVLKSF